ncbi:MAG: NUDIX domain-containing protein [Eubacterium sp.]|nr:NUDIX domain-containing protein [Eubacterium sp.]MBR0413315.1 NUDIX domain-containing protein [Eubacterium sp.]
MMIIEFYNNIPDNLIKFAVIISRTVDGKWVLCKHKDRETFEVPGGHRERGETPLETAKRELHEETGAIDFCIKSICYYSIKDENSFGGEETYGLLCYADIAKFENKLYSEIESIFITDDLPDNWTYPEIQQKLFVELKKRNVI